jgi:N-methylhydantoinase A/oxoprolinase/acetone carboxylase beta subunit
MSEAPSGAGGIATDRRYYAVRGGGPEYLGPSLGGTGLESATELGSGVGLGIDAGGTYTDAVLYDFKARSVIAAAKALTTHGNPALGIGEALDSLPLGRFPGLRRVSLATTFATNAIVEGKGRKVGLILAGYDGYDLARISHRPLKAVSGYHDIMGNLQEELDETAVESTLGDLLEKDCVEALAVTSAGGCRNPEHELRIKELARRRTGLPIVMGHELSNELDRILRATTTALNARIAPLIAELAGALEGELLRRGIVTPLTIVRADGSLMNLGEACEKPIEMILSGPAASVQGALRLSGLEAAVVVDMGGTTSDVALTARGRPVMSGRGAVIGEYRTTVRTLKSSSIGLGGDSEVREERGELRVGPRRILPISYAASMDGRVRECHAEISASRLAELGMMHPAQVFVLASEPGSETWMEEDERRILAVLRAGPANILELSRALDNPFLSCLPLRRLEDFGYVMRCGLTPTDLLHAEGSFLRWDAEVAKTALASFASRVGTDVATCASRLRAAMTEKLAMAVLTEGIADPGRPRRDGELALGGLGERFWAGAISGKADGAFSYSLRLGLPLIGVGAPIAEFLPDLARLLGTSAVCPEHADTAGAVGAVISSVTEELELLIRTRSGGGYSLFGPDFKQDFAELGAAKEAAMQRALGAVIEKAREGELGEFIVELRLEDEAVRLAYGLHYLETRVRAAALAMV